MHHQHTPSSSRVYYHEVSTLDHRYGRKTSSIVAAAATNHDSHDEAAAKQWQGTPNRPTIPSRCHTPSRPTSKAAANCASAFMTQLARGESTTPKAQTSRPTSSHAHTAPVRRAPSLLPSTGLERRMLLVLDMDETLLHADVSPVPHDVSFVVTMEHGASTPVYVKFRPHLNRFLTTVGRLFEVVVFTASIPRYANQVLDYIDPRGEFVHHRLFREHCTEVNGAYVKDLDRLGRPLSRVAIVDNSPVAYSFHPENAVAIPSWYDCHRDSALQRLLPHLERMSRDELVYDSLNDIRRELSWD